ncbi:hypothetical protein [Endozoicomonas lisbonensis]|uniref:Uncharacterized protein n=1 Tax=Endozoicomonas lisbonensis TaxID=3120522 RepID=A0ABV2SI07_9GAMM
MNLDKILSLQKGDILIRHGKNKDIAKAFQTHVAVLAQATPKRLPTIFDLVRSLGLSKRTLPCELSVEGAFTDVWSAYRLNDEVIAAKAASIGHIWVCMHDSGTYAESFGQTSVKGVYSVSSTVSSFLGSSSFGPKAMLYAEYLCSQCADKPPTELQPGASGWFAGTICTYVPIALYQAACRSIALVNAYMAIDARRSLPRNLVNYLNGNPHWQFLGTF